jgi:hypothetical protein
MNFVYYIFNRFIKLWAYIFLRAQRWQRLFAYQPKN